VDAAEVWHFYDGAPLELRLSADGATEQVGHLGRDLAAGEQPQLVVPAHVWQSARSLGDHTLVGCTVSPGFEFAGFELAPADWSPQPGR
jgi:predicted cupin superfamily sugar epimerase